MTQLLRPRPPAADAPQWLHDAYQAAHDAVADAVEADRRAWKTRRVAERLLHQYHLKGLEYQGQMTFHFDSE